MGGVGLMGGWGGVGLMGGSYQNHPMANVKSSPLHLYMGS